MPTNGLLGCNKQSINQIRRSVEAGKPLTQAQLVKHTRMQPDLILPLIRSYEWGTDFQYAGTKVKKAKPRPVRKTDD